MLISLGCNNAVPLIPGEAGGHDTTNLDNKVNHSKVKSEGP